MKQPKFYSSGHYSLLVLASVPHIQYMYSNWNGPLWKKSNTPCYIRGESFKPPLLKKKVIARAHHSRKTSPASSNADKTFSRYSTTFDENIIKFNLKTLNAHRFN